MSKKVATHIQYGGALYRLKEGGGLGTTSKETNVSLFSKDFDSEGELQYSGTPEGGQFFFESRVKFPDDTLLPISLPIDEASAAQIIAKLVKKGDAQFTETWRSRLPESFLEKVESELEGAKALPAPKDASTKEPVKVTAIIHPWRVTPETTVSKIDLRIGSAGVDRNALEAFSRRAYATLSKRFKKAKVTVSVDGREPTDQAYLSVYDRTGSSTSDHDQTIQELLFDVWQRMHS